MFIISQKYSVYHQSSWHNIEPRTYRRIMHDKVSVKTGQRSFNKVKYQAITNKNNFDFDA